MGNTFKKESTTITYDHRVQPSGSSNPVYSSTPQNGYSYSTPTPSTTQNIATFHPASKTAVKDGVQGTEKVRIETEVETADGFRKLDFVMDNEQFVRLFMDPRIELMISDMSYLIGYKMVYVVDAYRKRLPNVIAIVTMKINNNNNAIFQSEGKHSKKETYEMMNLSKRIGQNNHYSRDSQADSLRHTGGDMIAWEHSTKFCAHNVETLALTFCGKFKDVINACRKYDTNMAFAESAYTHEENQEPVVYEVGVTNYSKHDRPNVASGGCLDFFHFFLRPEYAMDYGFWQFQYSEGKSDVNKAEIVLGKKFSDLRKVTHKDLYQGEYPRDRAKVKLVKTDKGYMSSQVMTNAEQDKMVNRKVESAVDHIADELMKEIASAPTPAPILVPIIVPMTVPTIVPTITQNTTSNAHPDLQLSVEDRIVSCVFDTTYVQPSKISTDTKPLLNVDFIPKWDDSLFATELVNNQPVDNQVITIQPVALETQTTVSQPQNVDYSNTIPQTTVFQNQNIANEYPVYTKSINGQDVDKSGNQYNSYPTTTQFIPDVQYPQTDGSGLRFRGHNSAPDTY